MGLVDKTVEIGCLLHGARSVIKGFRLVGRFLVWGGLACMCVFLLFLGSFLRELPYSRREKKKDDSLNGFGWLDGLTCVRTAVPFWGDRPL